MRKSERQIRRANDFAIIFRVHWVEVTLADRSESLPRRMVLYLRGLARPSQRLSSVSKSLRRTAHGFSASPAKTILPLVDTRIASPIRFSRAPR